jgi:RNA 3'-terminal phosphate cyclase (ATP)
MASLKKELGSAPSNIHRFAMADHVTIDGSRGEGGGQIVRSSLALSMLTGKPVTIENMRARRDKSGLMRQHLTAVHAAAAICGPEVSGAAIGSSKLDFRPGRARPGAYRFDVGSAEARRLSSRRCFRRC